MKLYRVMDIEPDEVLSSTYDWGIFVSGYESRGTFLSTQVGRSRIAEPIVFGFDTMRDDPTRRINDLHYRVDWGIEPRLAGADEDENVLCTLRDMGRLKPPMRILCDYSSMSRLWYMALLNWARYSPHVDDIIIDFAYAVGRYDVRQRTQMVINDILALPGCEGGATRVSKSIAIFGLGFDYLAALCVLDRLEPDVVYGYLANPGADDAIVKRVRSANRELVTKHTKRILELPIWSVEKSYSRLVEVVLPYVREADVTIIPMGPKPHVLTAILLAMRFADVTCLRVGGKRERGESVHPVGKIIATRVHLRS